MEEWKEHSLLDIAEIYDQERVPLSKMERSVRKGEFPYYGASGVIDYVNSYLFDGEFVLISEDGENLRSRQTPIAFKASGRFWVNNHAHILRGKKEFYNELIIHYFKNLDLNPYLTGAVQPKLNQANLLSIPILLPVREKEQKAIAAVLSSLNDKIDLLHRQNKTLEAMTETLFRQWFVEEAQDDWQEVTLESVTTRITDGAHQSPPTVEIGLPMASVKDMHQWGINADSCRHISPEDFEELTKADCRPLKNDILIAKDGSYLKHVFVTEDDMDIVILSSIAMLRPNWRYHPILLAIFLKLQSTRESLENIVTGAVIPRIVLKDFRKFKLLLPPSSKQEQAMKFINPIYEKCWGNNRQIRTLEKLRDTLLPKLMSGEVRIACDKKSKAA